MPERPGPWALLDHPADPVTSDLEAVRGQVDYFRTLADALRTQSARLDAIASGDSLAGKYADELRRSAGEVGMVVLTAVGIDAILRWRARRRAPVPESSTIADPDGAPDGRPSSAD